MMEWQRFVWVAVAALVLAAVGYFTYREWVAVPAAERRAIRQSLSGLTESIDRLRGQVEESQVTREEFLELVRLSHTK